MRRLSDEAAVFGRLAVFGVVVGAIYWFATYEIAGTVLLLGFGAASGIATAVLWASPPSRSIAESDPDDRERSILEVEYQRIPAPLFAPFLIGLGAGITGLGLALGPLILPLGVTVAIVGARAWLEAVMREAQASATADSERSVQGR